MVEWVLLKGYSKAHLFKKHIYGVCCAGTTLSLCGYAVDDNRARLPVVESTERCARCLKLEEQMKKASGGKPAYRGSPWDDVYDSM